MAEDLEQVERELNEAVSAVLNRHKLLTTRWVLVAEVLDEAGQRQCASFVSPDLRVWDSLGMLGFILEREREAVHAAERHEDG
ncbi:hypothetical protein AB0F93_00225 [Micromonospora tulbaghiae]|uniref:hypothetical protein n=1 Tax=Micromonospora tulbaghiae TaxID=479978 RepID=UPI00332B2237